jgi:hypothetical protein
MKGSLEQTNTKGTRLEKFSVEAEREGERKKRGFEPWKKRFKKCQSRIR